MCSGGKIEGYFLPQILYFKIQLFFMVWAFKHPINQIERLTYRSVSAKLFDFVMVENILKAERVHAAAWRTDATSNAPPSMGAHVSSQSE